MAENWPYMIIIEKAVFAEKKLRNIDKTHAKDTFKMLASLDKTRYRKD